MGKLRDVFSKVGFCESTADLARKPQLVEQLVRASAARVDRSLETNTEAPYEERLRAALSCANVYALDTLIREDVTVCLDQRLGQQKEGWFTTTIHAGFYTRNGESILSLYDDGRDPAKTRWLSTGFDDFAKDAINQLANLMNRKKWQDWQNPEMFGARRSRYNAATKMTDHYFDWSRPGSFASELKKNPALAEPPVKLKNAPPRRAAPGF